MQEFLLFFQEEAQIIIKRNAPKEREDRQ